MRFIKQTIAEMRKQIVTFLEKLKDRCFKDSGLADPKVHSRKIDETHWLSIPNVKNFHITIQDNNTLLEYLNLKKRNAPTFEYESYRNLTYNLYMHRQIKRLRSLKSDPVKFFKIVRHLLKNSKIFRVSAINKTMVNWYKVLPLELVFKVNRQVDQLLKSNSTNLMYRRVYIPKGEDNYRPLGVPELSWRVLLQMYQNFLYIFLEDKFLDSQHGFIPNKGTLTAWKDLIEKIDHYKYIYEYDLRNYFEEIDIDMLTIRLKQAKIPHDEVYWIKSIISNTPVLPENQYLHESNVHRKEWDRVSKFIEFSQTEKPLENSFNKNAAEVLKNVLSLPKPLKGVPQGCNLSPLLSLIPLRYYFLVQQESVSYADDGVFFGNEPFEIIDDEFIGVELNKKKSGWVKYDGEWKKPLKFLGLEYEDGKITANTRKGSKLSGETKKIEFGLLNHSSLQSKNVSSDMTWNSILKGRWGGFLVSKLYNGTWNLKDFEQDFLYKIWKLPYKSWAYKNMSKEHTIYNAGSYASHSLIKMLTNRKRTSFKRLNLGLLNTQRNNALMTVVSN